MSDSSPSTPPRAVATGETEVVALDRDMTMAIVILNLAVFFAQSMLTPGALAQFDHRYALSWDGLHSGAWWQLLTYQFLHGGWLHLVFNLLFLHSLGPVLETTFGGRRFLGVYLVSGVLGGGLQKLGSASAAGGGGHPVVGASSGLCGLLAALGSIYAETRLPVLLFFLIPIRVKAKILLLAFALISVAGTFVKIGHVAHLAHLGGLVGGLLMVNLMSVKPLDLVPASEVPAAK